MLWPVSDRASLRSYLWSTSYGMISGRSANAAGCPVCLFRRGLVHHEDTTDRPPSHRASLRTPVRDQLRARDHRGMASWWLSSADGLTGWGECVAGAGPWYSYETIDTAWHVLRDYLAPLLLGLEMQPARGGGRTLQRRARPRHGPGRAGERRLGSAGPRPGPVAGRGCWAASAAACRWVSASASSQP